MNEVISLKEAERKVFGVATQDGLLDIFIGCVFLMFVVAPFLSSALGDFWSSAVFVPFWAVVILAIWLVRKYIVRPRIGEVKFGPARKTRLLKFNYVMLCANTIAFIGGALIAANSETLTGRQTSAIFGLTCLVLFSVAAHYLDSRRLYIYGLLIGLSPLAGEWLWDRGYASHHGFPITFGVSAGVMILMGVFIFLRLLRENPIPAEVDPDAEDSRDE